MYLAGDRWSVSTIDNKNVVLVPHRNGKRRDNEFIVVQLNDELRSFNLAHQHVLIGFYFFVIEAGTLRHGSLARIRAPQSFVVSSSHD
jgi:hypothetical protein